MKKVLAAISIMFAVAACTPTEQGAAAGAVAGALIGRASESNQCRYRDQYGRVYTARCPSGY